MKTRRNLASVCLALSCGALLTAANVTVGDQPGVIRMTSGQEAFQPPAVPPANSSDAVSGSGDVTPVPDQGVPSGQGNSVPTWDNASGFQDIAQNGGPVYQEHMPFAEQVDYTPYMERSAGVTESPVLGRRPYENPVFGPTMMFETNFNDGLGFNEVYHRANVRLPYHVVPGNSVLMADLSAAVTNTGQASYNFGAVWRNYDPSRNRVFGWNAFYDMDDGLGNEQWQRLGVGVESLGKYLDFRANGYYIMGDESALLEDRLVGDLALRGNSVFRIRNQTRDNAYGGADFEIGGPLPILGRRGINLYGGAYYLDSEFGHETVGGSARLEALITESATLNVNYTNDDTFGVNSWVSIAFTIPNYRERAILQPRVVRDRLADPVRRSTRIHTNLDVIDVPEALTNNSKGRAWRFEYIDPNATSITNGGLGAGTLEDPWTTLQAAANNNTPATDIFRISPRADDSGENLTVAGGMQLFDCQVLSSSVQDYTLFAEDSMNFVVPGIETATNLGPLVSNPNIVPGGSVIRLANENTVHGLRIDGSNSVGTSFGTGITNPLPIRDTNIVSNTFTNYNTAVDLRDVSGNIVLDANTSTGTLGVAQSGLILTTATGSMTDLLIRSNTVSGSDVIGIGVTASTGSTVNADNPNGFNAPASGILGNTVSGNGSTGVGSPIANGIVIEALAGARANIVAEGNSSSENTGSGLVVRANAGTVNMVSLRNNTMDLNDENGVFLHYLNGGRFFAQSEDVNEDLNFNGILDPGEDLDGDGTLDAANGILDAGEDINGNGVLDQGIVSNTFSGNTLAGLCIFGEDTSSGIFDIGGPQSELGNTMIGNLGAGIATDLTGTATARMNTLNNIITADLIAASPLNPDVTIILDFWEASQGALVDPFNNFNVTAFDPTGFGFAATDFDLVTNSVLNTIRQQFYGIPTVSQDGRSPIPDGQQLAIDFVIGDLGQAPSNGATEFYTMVIGSTPDNTGGITGTAGLSLVRDANGVGPNFGTQNGDQIGVIYSSVINGIGGLNPADLTAPVHHDHIPGQAVSDIVTTPGSPILNDALTSGNLLFTSNALAGTTSHEIGHALSLLHLDVAGSQTPSGLAPIMGTGAIDLQNQRRIEGREFGFSGVNSQAGGAQQFHVQQLMGALGTRTAVQPGLSGDGVVVNASDSAKLLPSNFIGNQITRNSGDALKIVMNDSARAEGVTIQGNLIEANGGRGVDLIASGAGAFIDADGTIGGTGNNIIAGESFTQGNLITGNQNDGIRALAQNGGAIFGNALNNQILSNGGNGIGLYVDGSGFVDFGTPASNRLISGNIITGNGGAGIDIVSTVAATGQGQVDAVVRNNEISGNVGGGISSKMFGPNTGGATNNLVNLTIGGTADETNIIDGNGDFGIQYSVAGNAKGVFSLTNSIVSGTLDGPDPLAFGDGIRLTRADSSLLLATIDNVTSINNQGNGLVVDVQGNDKNDPNQPMVGTVNTVNWTNSLFESNGINGALFQVRGDAMLIADGSSNVLTGNGLHGALVQTSENSTFGDVTVGLPPGRRVLWDGFTSTFNGADGIHFLATESSRANLEITSNRVAGSSGAHAALNTNGDTSISENTSDGIHVETNGGASDILVTSGTGQTTLNQNGRGGEGGNGIRWDARGESDATVRVVNTVITNSFAGSTEDLANNGNNIFDPGEDINGNGTFEQGEDGNNLDVDVANGDGIQFNVFDLSTSTLQVGGIGEGNRIQNNADDGVAITATGESNNIIENLFTNPVFPKPVISISNNLIGGEFDGVDSGNGGDGVSLNLLGGVADIVQIGADPANIDTDLNPDGLISFSDGVQQSGPIVQMAVRDNEISQNGRIGVNMRLNGAAGERDRENGNSTFDPVRIVLTGNEISSNGAEGIYFRGDSDMNQGRLTYLANFPFPNPPFNPANSRPLGAGFYDPLLPQYQADNALSVNGNTAFLGQAPDGEAGFLNLRTVQNSFLTITGNIVQNNGTNTVTGEGMVIEVGTGSYLAADVRNNTFGGNLEEDVRTGSFLSAGNTYTSVNDTGATNFDAIYHDDTAQLDMRFTNNTGNQLDFTSGGAKYTNFDLLKQTVLGLDFVTPATFGVTDRDAGLFQIDDGGNLDNPNNTFINFGITQDIDGTFATGGFNIRAAADPLFPNIGFAPFLP